MIESRGDFGINGKVADRERNKRAWRCSAGGVTGMVAKRERLNWYLQSGGTATHIPSRERNESQRKLREISVPLTRLLAQDPPGGKRLIREAGIPMEINARGLLGARLGEQFVGVSI